MMLVGFGYLMAFLKCYGLGAVGLLCAIALLLSGRSPLDGPPGWLAPTATVPACATLRACMAALAGAAPAKRGGAAPGEQGGAAPTELGDGGQAVAPSRSAARPAVRQQQPQGRAASGSPAAASGPRCCTCRSALTSAQRCSSAAALAPTLLAACVILMRQEACIQSTLRRMES